MLWLTGDLNESYRLKSQSQSNTSKVLSLGSKTGLSWLCSRACRNLDFFLPFFLPRWLFINSCCMARARKTNKNSFHENLCLLKLNKKKRTCFSRVECENSVANLISFRPTPNKYNNQIKTYKFNQKIFQLM